MVLGISVNELFKGASKKDLDKIRGAKEELQSLPIYIDDYTGDMNYVLSTTRRFVAKYGVKVVYLDYLQLVIDRSGDTHRDLGKIARDAKLIAKKLGITFVALSQLNRNLESREDKRPTLSDLRGSGNLEEDADIVIGIYREGVYKPDYAVTTEPTEAIILKHRNGSIGRIDLNFEKATNRMTRYNGKT
jgi:replicative DNA helicase